MSLAKRLSMAPPGPNGKQFCTVGRLIAGDLGAEDRGVLISALADRQWSSTAIARVLHDEGHPLISERHLRAHRRGDHTEATCMAHDLGVIR